MQNALTLWKRTCVISCATARSMQPNTKQRKELLCDCYEKTFQNWITFVNCSSHADTALRTKALDWSTFYNFEILRSVILLLPFFQMFLIYFILPLIHCFYVLFPHFFFHLLCSPYLTQQATPFVELMSSVFISQIIYLTSLSSSGRLPRNCSFQPHFMQQWPRSALRGSSTTPSLLH